MAYNPIVSSIDPYNVVSMECFRGRLLDDAINWLHEFAGIQKKGATTHRSEYCFVHQRSKQDLFCMHCGADMCRECTTTKHKGHEHIASSDKIHEEVRRLGEGADNIVGLLEEMKQAILGVKEMRQRVRNRKDDNINATRDVFATLRKAIDESEEQTIADVKNGAESTEKALELQLEKLVLLWTQLKNCLELIKKTSEDKMSPEELTKRRVILEKRRENFKKMKQQTKLEPVMSEQGNIKFDYVENLCQAVSKLGLIPMDPSKCETLFPTMTVKKTNKFMIILRNRNNNTVSNGGKELNIFVKSIRDDKPVQVTLIKEVGDGRYEVSFTATRCGYHMISIIVEGQHIQGSPYKIWVDRDYHTIEEQDCSQMITNYGRHTFGRLGDVAIGQNGEVVLVDSDNDCVVVLDNKLNLLNVIGQGSGNSRLVNPDGVAVTDDVVAVSDWDSHQVKKYSLQGELLSVIGCHGDKNGQFKDPRGLAFSNNKLLYVVDRVNCRIQVFQQDNGFAFSFKNRGLKLQFPDRIAIDPNNDDVFITNHSGKCVYHFTHSGQFIQEIKCDKSPYAITISPSGYLITSHAGSDNKIRVWSSTHQLITQFGNSGSEQGEFSGISGIGIDSTGSIYVVEWFNGRLQVISDT